MEPTPDTVTKPSYRHAIRLFALIFLLVAAALVARALMVPKGFGTFGHYRAAAVVDARQRTPRHQGKAKCGTCHDDIYKLHRRDAHANVNCETCHGAGVQHVKDPSKANIQRNRSRELCLTCHQQLQARPGAFPTIEVAEHFKLVGVKDLNLACVKCHSPHEPLRAQCDADCQKLFPPTPGKKQRDLHSARLHPLVQRCRDCHTDKRDASTPKPPTHPPIFECSYCHSARVKDFANRKHKKLRCTTCHIFRKETDFAGRIVREAEPRFCLLCHRKEPFRSKDAPPGIVPKEHLKDGSNCLDCHQDALHGELPQAPAQPAPRPAADQATHAADAKEAAGTPVMAEPGERPAPPRDAMGAPGMTPAAMAPPAMAPAPTMAPGGMNNGK